MSDKIRILYIEDEPEMIELTRMVLEREGFEVLGAMGGNEGLEKIKQEKPDLILLDLMMPEMDGWEVYRRIKVDKDMADIPIIIVTAKTQSVDKALGLHVAKVDDYITKPFGPQDIVDSVQRVLARKGSP
jgi:two-component system, OmpR family, response regulator VicR